METLASQEEIIFFEGKMIDTTIIPQDETEIMEVLAYLLSEIKALNLKQREDRLKEILEDREKFGDKIIEMIDEERGKMFCLEGYIVEGVIDIILDVLIESE